MNIQQLKNDIFDANNPEKQIEAAYQMRYFPNDPEARQILFDACYQAKNPTLQQVAVKTLDFLMGDRATEIFIKSTHSHDRERRMRGYYHLGTLSNPKNIDAVFRGLSDPDPKVRRAAVVSAGRLGRDYKAIHALKRLLNGYEPALVKSAVEVSIDMIKKRIDGRQDFNKSRSFNKPTTTNKYSRKSFNKSNYNPTTYTPKGF